MSRPKVARPKNLKLLKAATDTPWQKWIKQSYRRLQQRQSPPKLDPPGIQFFILAAPVKAGGAHRYQLWPKQVIETPKRVEPVKYAAMPNPTGELNQTDHSFRFRLSL
jgi:hypothetical protein